MAEYGFDAGGNEIPADQVCEECRGDGEVPSPEHRKAARLGWRKNDRTCPTCLGTGKRRREREYWDGKHPTESCT